MLAIAGIFEALTQRGNRSRQDQILSALLEAARHDQQAFALLVLALQPALARLCLDYGREWGEVYIHFQRVVSTYHPSKPTKIAGRIRGEVRKNIREQIKREKVEEIQRQEYLESQPTSYLPRDGDGWRILQVWVRAGLISQDEARLVHEYVLERRAHSSDKARLYYHRAIKKLERASLEGLKKLLDGDV